MSSTRRGSHVPIDLSGRTPAELKSLRLRIDAALMLAGQPEKEPADRTEEVADEVVRQLNKRGAEKIPKIHFLKRASFWPAMRKGSEVVAAYVEKHAPETASKRNSRRRAYAIVVGVLVRWMESIHVPVTVRTVAVSLDKIPAVMDRQFPGYAANHFLEWVFTPRR